MRKVIGGVSALVLGTVGALAFTLPAHAAPQYDWTFVCNSDYSVSNIRVYSDFVGAQYSYNVAEGGCTGIIFNGYDNLRVDVEDRGFGDLDVNSYKIGEISIGWGPCHTNSENPASNPPDSYNWNGIRYRNYDTTACT